MSRVLAQHKRLSALSSAVIIAAATIALVIGLVAVPNAKASGHGPNAPARTTNSAPATVSCSGSSCAGRDANYTGCSSGGYVVPGVTNNPLYLGLNKIEMWWSPTCQTNWAIVYSGYDNSFIVGWIERGHTSTITYQSGGDGFRYGATFRSPMAYAPTQATRACAKIVHGSDVYGPSCTGWSSGS